MTYYWQDERYQDQVMTKNEANREAAEEKAELLAENDWSEYDPAEDGPNTIKAKKNTVEDDILAWDAFDRREREIEWQYEREVMYPNGTLTLHKYCDNGVGFSL